MHMVSTRIAKSLMTGAVIAASAGLYSAPAAAATQYRSFYQNTGSSCHGTTPTQESKLRRFSQSLRNTNTADAKIVCNLSTDWLSTGAPAQSGGSVNGNVAYVAIWAKNLTPATPKSMTCTLTDGYANEPGSATYTFTVTTLASGTSQSVFEWTPDAGKQFLAPINVTCALPSNAELNDWFVVYEEDVGA